MIKSFGASRSSFFPAILSVAGLLSAAPAAFGVTIDPTTFAAETDISTATPGVVLSAPDYGGSSSVIAVPFNSLSLNGSFIGHPGDDANWSISDPLQMLFTEAIGSVSVSFEMDSGSYNNDPGGYGELIAYNSMGTQIGMMSTLPGSGDGTVTVSLPGISYALAFIGGDTAGYDVVGITSIYFDPGVTVPDHSSTIVLFGIALCGLGLFTRKFSVG